MPKTPGEAVISVLTQAAFLRPWVFPNLFYKPGKEAADLIVRFGDVLLIASEKTSRFQTDLSPENAWNRWHRRTIVAGARQIVGAERQLTASVPQLFTDAKCLTPAPTALFAEPPKEVFRVVFAHGSGLSTQRYFQANTAGLRIDSQPSGAPPTTPFAINPFIDGDVPFHILDDYSSIELFRFIDTAPDLFNYLRKKEAFLRRFERFRCHGEHELIQYYLRHVDGDGEHGFEKLIERAEGHRRLHWTEDSYTEFRQWPVVINRLRDDAPSYIVDQYINKLAETSDKRVSPTPEHEELSLRKLASFNRTTRRMIGTNLVELTELDEDRDYTSRVTFGIEGQPLGKFAFIYLCVRADLLTDDTDNIERIQDFAYLLARVHTIFVIDTHPHITDFVCFHFIKDKPRHRSSEGLSFLRPSEYTPEEIASLREALAEIGVGQNRGESRTFELREYRNDDVVDE